jgi:hypothetical protein
MLARRSASISTAALRVATSHLAGLPVRALPGVCAASFHSHPSCLVASSSRSPPPPSKKPSSPVTPEAAALDASLPDLSGFEDTDDPKLIARRLLAEEDARREANKNQWKEYALTMGGFTAVSFLLLGAFGFEITNPFKAEEVVKKPPAWKFNGPITEATPAWVVWFRQRTARPAPSPQAQQDAWLARLREENKFEQEMEVKYREKYGLKAAAPTVLDVKGAMASQEQAKEAAKAAARHAAETDTLKPKQPKA